MSIDVAHVFSFPLLCRGDSDDAPGHALRGAHWHAGTMGMSQPRGSPRLWEPGPRVLIVTGPWRNLVAARGSSLLVSSLPVAPLRQPALASVSAGECRHGMSMVLRPAAAGPG